MINHPARPATAEFLGTCLLVMTVVGSGIMADRLSDDVAVSLLGNTIPTGAILVVLIMLFAPVSGAHFNPAVTLVFTVRGDISKHVAVIYVVSQIAGGIIGALLAHQMFELPVLQTSATVRTGGAQWLAEVIATFGLLLTILGGLRVNPGAIPWLVGLYITAAYWFTASTSFANPAVAISRAFTDTFSGIRPVDVPGFVIAECCGALLAWVVARWLFSDNSPQNAD